MASNPTMICQSLSLSMANAPPIGRTAAHTPVNRPDGRTYTMRVGDDTGRTRASAQRAQGRLRAAAGHSARGKGTTAGHGGGALG
jgi:hypothetical protein